MNIKDVHSYFVRLTGTLLGSKVTKVIKAHPNAPQPQKPYLVVDVLNVLDEDSWITDRRTQTTGETKYTTHKLITLTFRCHGEGSFQNMIDLQNYMKFERVFGQIRKDLGAGITFVDDVRELPTKISDMLFDEAAEFIMTINIPDELIDEDSTYADTFDFTFEIHRGQGDPDPFVEEFVIDDIS